MYNLADQKTSNNNAWIVVPLRFTTLHCDDLVRHDALMVHT